MKKAIIAGFMLAVSVVGGCSMQQSSGNQAAANTKANAGPKDNGWDAYIDHFLTDYFPANPQLGAYQGKHELDGKFSDWSDAGLAKEIARLKTERDKAAAFKDTDLDERQRFERSYVIAQIDKDLFWRETADQPH